MTEAVSATQALAPSTRCTAALENEAQRRALLHSMELLDKPPEQAFDAITRLAAQFTGRPIALIGLVPLNLALSLCLVESMGVRIDVSSQLGEGSRFPVQWQHRAHPHDRMEAQATSAGR